MGASGARAAGSQSTKEADPRREEPVPPESIDVSAVRGADTVEFGSDIPRHESFVSDARVADEEVGHVADESDKEQRRSSRRRRKNTVAETAPVEEGEPVLVEAGPPEAAAPRFFADPNARAWAVVGPTTLASMARA